MTSIEEIANQLDYKSVSDLNDESTLALYKDAHNHRIVIAFATGKDDFSLRGFITDDVEDETEDGELLIDTQGLVPINSDGEIFYSHEVRTIEECKNLIRRHERSVKLNNTGYKTVALSTDLPFAKFNVSSSFYEDLKGIVFRYPGNQS
jgi:hypothetical protein